MAEDRAFDWNDVIENDGGEFTLLPEGTYPFTVLSFERGEFPGSEKMPACKKAVLTIRIDGGTLGATDVTENLFLHSRAEWKLCQFFTAIGQRQHGEQLRMDWSKVPGSRGLCEVGVREYRNKDGEQKKSNQITKYLEPKQAPQTGGFTAGKF